MRKDLQAIILAAGFGKRMRPLSYTLHKTLLEINGVSVLANIVGKLIKNDVTEITLVLGYQAGEIQKHLDQQFHNLIFRPILYFCKPRNLCLYRGGMKYPFLQKAR